MSEDLTSVYLYAKEESKSEIEHLETQLKDKSKESDHFRLLCGTWRHKAEQLEKENAELKKYLKIVMTKHLGMNISKETNEHIFKIIGKEQEK